VTSVTTAALTKAETTSAPITASGVLSDFVTTTWTSTDREGKQILHYVLERFKFGQDFTSDSLLSLAIIRDHESFGWNPTHKPRTIHDFLQFATNTTLASQEVFLAILTASLSEFELYRKILTSYPDDEIPPQNPSITNSVVLLSSFTLVVHVPQSPLKQ